MDIRNEGGDRAPEDVHVRPEYEEAERQRPFQIARAMSRLCKIGTLTLEPDGQTKPERLASRRENHQVFADSLVAGGPCPETVCTPFD